VGRAIRSRYRTAADQPEDLTDEHAKTDRVASLPLRSRDGIASALADFLVAVLDSRRRQS
jgi:hypothetical protein